MKGPSGAAIDPIGMRIYWVNSVVSGTVSYANLDGSGSADLNTAGATVSEPNGIAVDPDAHRVYWANAPGGIAFADTGGAGGTNVQVAGGFASGALNSPNLLLAPVRAAPPRVKGSAKPGGKLRCDSGVWGEDVISASLYRAPAAYAYDWSRSGRPVSGASATSLTAKAVGEYRCTVTASNVAGSAWQTSQIVAIFKIGKVKLDRAAGTAKVAISLPGTGRIAISGKGAKAAKRKVKGAKTLRVKIRAKGKRQKQLLSTGKARLKLTFRFTTSDASVAVQRKSVVLRKK